MSYTEDYYFIILRRTSTRLITSCHLLFFHSTIITSRNFGIKAFPYFILLYFLRRFIRPYLDLRTVVRTHYHTACNINANLILFLNFKFLLDNRYLCVIFLFKISKSSKRLTLNRKIPLLRLNSCHRLRIWTRNRQF